MASGEAINANHQGDVKASMRRARSVVNLIEFWRAMLRTTDFLQQDEDDEDNNDEDHIWVCTPTPRNMADLVSEETLKKAKKEESGATAGATETVATPTMSPKVAHELRSRSVEVREYLTPKSKAKPKSRKKEDPKENSPIRSSTPTPIQMTEEDREREDKVMEKGSAGKKKKAVKKGKGGSPHKTLVEEEKEKEKEGRKEGRK